MYVAPVGSTGVLQEATQQGRGLRLWLCNRRIIFDFITPLGNFPTRCPTSKEYLVYGDEYMYMRYM